MILTDPESIAALELRSVPAGLAVLDALVKEATVRIRHAGDIDPGRWLIVFDGPLAEVEAALARGVEIGDVDLLETLMLPAAHVSLRGALRGLFASPAKTAASELSLGAIECHTVLATLAAADRALKAAEVGLLRLRLATHVGGSGHAVVTGEQFDVEAALEAAREGAETGVLVQTRLVARAAIETVRAAAQRSTGDQPLRPLDA